MNNDLNNDQSGMVLGNIDLTQNDNGVPNNTGNQTSMVESLDDSQVLPSNDSLMENNTTGLVMDNTISPVIEQPPQAENVPPQVESVPPQPMPDSQVMNPTPQPQPPQPTPQTGFQPQNAIGTTPPVSLEPEKKPKKPMNKTIFVILVIVALLGVGFGTYYILNYTDLLTKKEDIVIETKNLELELGATLPSTIAEYATITGTNISNCNPVDASEVNVNAVGVYKYTITCGNVSKIGTIAIVDNSELVVQTKTVYKSKGETVTAKEFAALENDGLTYEFVSQSDVDAALASEKGTYPVKLKVSNGTKTNEEEANLVILEYKIKGYVTCEANSQVVDEINASKVTAEKFGIFDDESVSYAGFGYEITTFTFTDATIYKQYEDEFKENGKVTIDGINGITEFSTNSDGASVIRIITELDNNKTLLEYGEENMKDYSSITKYFGKTATGLGYSCSFKKA